MFNITKKNMEWNGASLSLETGKIARKSSASVLVKYNDTTVLVTVTMGKKNDQIGFGTALTVNFVYKAYSLCKIPGGFIKREGKPSEREILASRVIDRSIRPLIPSNFHNEVYITCSLLEYDNSIIPEVPSIIGVSAALNISEVPFLGTVIATHIGYLDNDYQLNVISNDSLLKLIVASTQDSILMIESESKELNEKVILDGIMFGYDNAQPIIGFIDNFSDEVGRKAKVAVTAPSNAKIISFIKENYEQAIQDACKEVIKQKRLALLESIREEIINKISDEDAEQIAKEINQIEKSIVRNKIINDDYRIDGRKHDEIRDIDIVKDILPQTHGSALFTRGYTQSLAVVTLGCYNDEQIIDGVEGSKREHFMLHYNFPPYSVGEASPLRPTGRREIGHGRLAWHALQAVLPGKDVFPYTVRVVSEITESDGSSSMATVCSSSLALMVAGVPIKRHVAGIAMGLIKEAEKSVVLSDILGEEDYLGDMDFKVVGTEEGITALQMDMKIPGIGKEVLHIALQQAKNGRFHILQKICDAIKQPYKKLKKHAPCVISFQINKDDIVKVIGSGGKVIKNICEVSKAKVDIESDGRIIISAESSEFAEKAQDMLNGVLIAPKIGQVYAGEVVGIAEFGVFIKFLGGFEGLVHISEIQEDRVDNIKDIVSIGKKIKCVVISIKDNRIRLSMRCVDQKSGELSSEVDSLIKSNKENQVCKKNRRNINGSTKEINNNKSRRPKFF